MEIFHCNNTHCHTVTHCHTLPHTATHCHITHLISLCHHSIKNYFIIFFIHSNYLCTFTIKRFVTCVHHTLTQTKVNVIVIRESSVTKLFSSAFIFGVNRKSNNICKCIEKKRESGQSKLRACLKKRRAIEE